MTMFCPFDAADRPLASLPRSPTESLNRPGQRVPWHVFQVYGSKASRFESSRLRSYASLRATECVRRCAAPCPSLRFRERACPLFQRRSCSCWFDGRHKTRRGRFGLCNWFPKHEDDTEDWVKDLDRPRGF